MLNVLRYVGSYCIMPTYCKDWLWRYPKQNRSPVSCGKPGCSGLVNWIESASQDNTFSKRRIAVSCGKSDEAYTLPKAAA